MARFNFDTADYEEESKGMDFELLPTGEYVLMCTECEEKNTKAGTGTLLSATMEVVDGEFTNRKIWFNFNINNPSAKAESIGRGQVRAWAKACGDPDAEDTDVLIDVPFSAVVGVSKGTGGYADSNDIKKFIDPEEATESGAFDDAEDDAEVPVKAAKPAASKSAKAAVKKPAKSTPKAPAQAGGNPWA